MRAANDVVQPAIGEHHFTRGHVRRQQFPASAARRSANLEDVDEVGIEIDRDRKQDRRRSVVRNAQRLVEMTVEEESRAIDVQEIALDDQVAVDDQIRVGQVGGETVVVGLNA